jgi:hypothetical protein
VENLVDVFASIVAMTLNGLEKYYNQFHISIVI